MFTLSRLTEWATFYETVLTLLSCSAHLFEQIRHWSVSQRAQVHYFKHVSRFHIIKKTSKMIHLTHRNHLRTEATDSKHDSQNNIIASYRCNLQDCVFSQSLRADQQSRWSTACCSANMSVSMWLHMCVCVCACVACWLGQMMTGSTTGRRVRCKLLMFSLGEFIDRNDPKAISKLKRP